MYLSLVSVSKYSDTFVSVSPLRVKTYGFLETMCKYSTVYKYVLYPSSSFCFKDTSLITQKSVFLVIVHSTT